MRIASIAAALATLARSPLATDAFVTTSLSATASRDFNLKASSSDEPSATICDISSEFGDTPSLVGAPNGANAIRSAVVTNSVGDIIRIDDALEGGNTPQVVVYLRHMG